MVNMICKIGICSDFKTKIMTFYVRDSCDSELVERLSLLEISFSVIAKQITI